MIENKEAKYGTINNLVIKDMDFSEDYGVKVYAEPPEWSLLNYECDDAIYVISYEAVVQMYESLFENHPGYPEKLYGGFEDNE